jgi:hypothetical protein
MKQLLIVLLLLGYFSSGAQAQAAKDPKDTDKGYIGVFYGEVDSSDGGIENRNLGLVAGGSMESGPGVEFFYSDTVDKDTNVSAGSPDVRYSTQAWGFFGTYRFGSEYYALLKGGYAFIDVTRQTAGVGSQKFKEDGLSYGVGVGIEVGKNGAVELNYLVLPDIELSSNDQFLDVENELISLGYNWYF